MSAIRQKAIDGLKAGDTFSAIRRFTEHDVVQFADISRDYNPVHFDERFAGVKKFRDRICHGLLVASMVTEIGGQLGMLASGMEFEFRQPVYFGDTITCFFKITEIDERGRVRAKAVWRNQEEVTIMEASLTGIIPEMSERQVMIAMMAEGDPTNKLRDSK